MQEVSLIQMLEARENRLWEQQALLEKYHHPLICFTMNIPGPVKNSPLIERAFEYGCNAQEYRLPKERILYTSIHRAVTGCQAMYVVAMDAVDIKRVCTAIEDGTALGRLFDIDVLDVDGRKLDRDLVGGKSRDCIVCGQPGRGCSSRRTHTVQELQAATQRIMEAHFAQADREYIASMAIQSLLDEVCTTPKPGLVDCRNSGSHRDMDIFTFTASVAALCPYFQRCVQIGQETAQASSEETFAFLREAGLQAEQTMYQATRGINTHKGAIYTMGILCGSLGRLWRPESPIADMAQLLRECSRMVESSVAADFAKIKASASPDTAGQRLYLKHGLTGIRGEVAAGFPSVTNIALPIYRDCLKKEMSRNDAGTIALLHLIANVADTNLFHRGGIEGVEYAANTVADLLAITPYPSPSQISELDAPFISRNLSPGGCADLLAATYFLDTISK